MPCLYIYTDFKYRTFVKYVLDFLVVVMYIGGRRKHQMAEIDNLFKCNPSRVSDTHSRRRSRQAADIREADPMKLLDQVTDVVLAYRPKPKTKAAKRRIRRNKRAAKTKK